MIARQFDDDGNPAGGHFDTEGYGFAVLCMAERCRLAGRPARHKRPATAFDLSLDQIGIGLAIYFTVLEGCDQCRDRSMEHRIVAAIYVLITEFEIRHSVFGTL